MLSIRIRLELIIHDGTFVEIKEYATASESFYTNEGLSTALSIQIPDGSECEEISEVASFIDFEGEEAPGFSSEDYGDDRIGTVQFEIHKEINLYPSDETYLGSFKISSVNFITNPYNYQAELFAFQAPGYTFSSIYHYLPNNIDVIGFDCAGGENAHFDINATTGNTLYVGGYDLILSGEAADADCTVNYYLNEDSSASKSLVFSGGKGHILLEDHSAVSMTILIPTLADSAVTDQSNRTLRLEVHTANSLDDSAEIIVSYNDIVNIIPYRADNHYIAGEFIIWTICMDTNIAAGTPVTPFILDSSTIDYSTLYSQGEISDDAGKTWGPFPFYSQADVDTTPVADGDYPYCNDLPEVVGTTFLLRLPSFTSSTDGHLDIALRALYRDTYISGSASVFKTSTITSLAVESASYQGGHGENVMLTAELSDRAYEGQSFSLSFDAGGATALMHYDNQLTWYSGDNNTTPSSLILISGKATPLIFNAMDAKETILHFTFKTLSNDAEYKDFTTLFSFSESASADVVLHYNDIFSLNPASDGALHEMGDTVIWRVFLESPASAEYTFKCSVNNIGEVNSGSAGEYLAQGQADFGNGNIIDLDWDDGTALYAPGVGVQEFTLNLITNTTGPTSRFEIAVASAWQTPSLTSEISAFSSSLSIVSLSSPLVNAGSPLIYVATFNMPCPVTTNTLTVRVNTGSTAIAGDDYIDKAHYQFDSQTQTTEFDLSSQKTIEVPLNALSFTMTVDTLNNIGSSEKYLDLNMVLNTDSNTKTVRGTIVNTANYSIFVDQSSVSTAAIKHYFSNGGGGCYILPLTSGSNEEINAIAPAVTGRDDISVLGLVEEAGTLNNLTTPTTPLKILCAMSGALDEGTQRFLVSGIDSDLPPPGGDKTRSAVYAPYLFTDIILSTPPDADIPVSGVSGAATLADLKKLNYGMWSDISNEVQTHVNASVYTLSPTASVVAQYFNNDLNKGIWTTPANIRLSSVIDTTRTADEMKSFLSKQPLYVNLIRNFSGLGTLIWGARTLSTDPLMQFVQNRRLLSYIEDNARKVCRFVVFEPNTLLTWMKIKGVLNLFMEDLWEQGAFAGESEDEAWAVNVGLNETMSYTDIDEGIIKVNLSYAPLFPAEFITINLNFVLQNSTRHI